MRDLTFENLRDSPLVRFSNPRYLNCFCSPLSTEPRPRSSGVFHEWTVMSLLLLSKFHRLECRSPRLVALVSGDDVPARVSLSIKTFVRATASLCQNCDGRGGIPTRRERLGGLKSETTKNVRV